MKDRKSFQNRTRIIDFGANDSKTTAKMGPARAHLIIIRGRGTDLGRVLPVHAPITIGRDRACNLPLTDPRVSWHHARISPQQPDSCVLLDLDSTNGTRVDGKPIAASWNLRNGEKIFVGETILWFTEADQTDLAFQREAVLLVGSDPLTGLESKRRFDDTLDNALASAKLIKAPLAMLMMDMDGIRAINDRYGHPFGAHCIREAGRIIGAQVGSSGHACRFGGDDFTAFLQGTDRQGAAQTAEKIRAAIESAGIQKDGIDLKPTISIGVAAFPDDGGWVLDLVAAADQALYRAKTAGKNKVAMR